MQLTIKEDQENKEILTWEAGVNDFFLPLFL